MKRKMENKIKVSFRKFEMSDTIIHNLLTLAGFILSFLYVLFILTYHKMGWVEYLNAILIILLFSSRSLEIIKFWGLFLFFWIIYESQKIFAAQFARPVHVKDLYDFEVLLTGWFTGGKAIPFVFQEYRMMHAGSVLVTVTDLITATFYASHLVAPILLGISIFHKYKDSIEFKRFLFTFFGVNILALIVFQIYPAAPPWYVWNNGNGFNFDIPINDGTAIKDAAALKDVDAFLGINFFERSYASLNANAYSPVPSLHNAIAIMITFYALRFYGKKSNILILYPIGMAFSSMWLNHHYVVDILVSIIFIAIFVLLGDYLFKAENIEKEMEKEKEKPNPLVIHAKNEK